MLVKLIKYNKTIFLVKEASICRNTRERKQYGMAI